MLQPITPDERERHLRAFEQIARRILPVLCFSPDAIDQFLQRYAPLPGQDLYQLRLPSGHSAFLKSREPNTLRFEYLLPSDWHARHDIVRDVAVALKHDADATGRQVFFWIDDGFPSHNAYFAGLLASLGFALEPRVELLAPADLLAHLPVPALPEGIVERPFRPDDLSALNALYNLAFSVHPSRSPETNPLGHVPARDDTRQSFLALYHHGHPVALAFGTLPIFRYPSLYNGRFNLEELAVHPDHTRRGIGRYLAIRCMQTLQRLHPTPAREFFIGTDRTYAPALRLYHSLGFRPASYHTYATYDPVRPARFDNPAALI